MTVSPDPDATHARARSSPLIEAYTGALTDLLVAIDAEAVDRVVAVLGDARLEQRAIFVAGNGGSAATASHWVNDLNKATTRAGTPRMRAISLVDSVSWLTALANDDGYETVFSSQLENLARPGDVLVAISASGSSPNLVRAVDVAGTLGMRTIGFLGFDGGLLRDRVDELIWLRTPGGAYGLVESAHSVLCDIVTTCLASGDPAA